MATHYIMAIYPGSAETKVGIFKDEKMLFGSTLTHDFLSEGRLPGILAQVQERENDILRHCVEHGFDIASLDAVVGRCGPLPPVKQGAYVVDECMVDYLSRKSASEHPSKLGALMAWSLAGRLDVPAYVYDSIRADEIDEIARLSGHPELPRAPRTQMLSMRHACGRAARAFGKDETSGTFIVAYLGYGICLGLFDKGRMADYIGDDEGPFSPERSGRLPYRRLINLCYSGKYGHTKMMKTARNKGGLIGYLGTNDICRVEELIATGNEKARLVYNAMAYQVAKAIGELAAAAAGRVDGIVLTGDIAHSILFTGLVRERVEFIAPVEVMPGEHELDALACGTLRVLRGEETPNVFKLWESEPAPSQARTRMPREGQDLRLAIKSA
ncbi:MAG: butyrate kinase [Desulfovibrio sp.]|nr:butyrate kinase [Desulfovibrio sp.]